MYCRVNHIQFDASKKDEIIALLESKRETMMALPGIQSICTIVTGEGEITCGSNRAPIPRPRGIERNDRVEQQFLRPGLTKERTANELERKAHNKVGCGKGYCAA